MSKFYIYAKIFALARKLLDATLHSKNESKLKFSKKLASARRKYSNFKIDKSGFFKNQNGQFLKFAGTAPYVVARTKIQNARDA